MRIGLLTGGGDCPGLNAMIRAVGKSAITKHNAEVFGIKNGFQGLIEDSVEQLSFERLSGIINRGGTILGTNNRCDPLNYIYAKDENGSPLVRNAVEDCLQVIKKYSMDALLVIGGDGTMSRLLPFVELGIPCIGIPKTIDNDIIGTELSCGFTTAMTTATLSLDRLHTTAESHDRVIVCELMGRNSGWLTLESGIASGSDVILIPELPFHLESIINFIDKRRSGNKGFAIVAVAEGAKFDGEEQVIARHVEEDFGDSKRFGGIGDLVASRIQKSLGVETRTTVLGHVLRGGAPVAADRVLATRFGHAAVEALFSGATQSMVVFNDGKVQLSDLILSAKGQRLVCKEDERIAVARSLNTSFGQKDGPWA